MRKAMIFLILAILSTGSLFSQGKIVSGPMLGQVELRTACVWVEATPGSKLALWYWEKGNQAAAKKILSTSNSSSWYAPVKFDIVDLKMNTTYEYQVSTDQLAKKPTGSSGGFITKDLWQFRKPAPDFTFLTGSCAYFNEPIYDRPGKPYGNDSAIFETMAKEKASFMIWLGDNWYTREADYFSKWGLWYRASHDRAQPILQPFLKAMPHYAIWDDHDYGWNDADKSFPLKDESRKIFQSYWANPSYGENEEGIYSKVSYGDADFFLMDDRYFRSSDGMQDSVDGKPNPVKRMWGEKQMDWLKNALTNSRAIFKVIVTGSQTLNPASRFDCLQSYPIEFDELMKFLLDQKVEGVLFLTGDRHHSEVIKYPRQNAYTLYDITSSPLTSGVGKVSGAEKDNPSRIQGTLVETQNYARVTVAGKPRERTFSVEFIDGKGNRQGAWSISETELKMK